MSSVTLSRFVRRLLDQPPPGFHPGVTLDRALRELKLRFSVDTTDRCCPRLLTLDGRISCAVRERVERHFMMHVVSLEILLDVPARAEVGTVIHVRNTGVVFRTGVACSVRKGKREALRALTARLEADAGVRAALTVLDFRRCEITGSDSGWGVLLEPYGGSEVVNRMPSFRRYIGLRREQVEALAASLCAIHRVLAPTVTGGD